MRTHTAVRSVSAIGVGVIFTLITGGVLLEDVFRHDATITSRHVMTLAVLGGTVYFGHRLWREYSESRFGNTFGCAVLFLGGTLFCVLSSAGRNAEVVTNKVTVANAVNLGRELAKRDVDDAKARYAAALTAETQQCASGEGAYCKAARINSLVRRGQYDDAKAKLSQEKPDQIANSDIRAAAELVAKLPFVGGDVDSVAATLLLVFPFLQALFCEVAAICGFSIGLAHVRLPVASFQQVEIQRVSTEMRRKARTPDEQLVLDALSRAGRPLSNEELADELGCSTGEATKRRQVCEASGVIKTERAGKYLMISPATAH